MGSVLTFSLTHGQAYSNFLALLFSSSPLLLPLPFSLFLSHTHTFTHPLSMRVGATHNNTTSNSLRQQLTSRGAPPWQPVPTRTVPRAPLQGPCTWSHTHQRTTRAGVRSHFRVEHPQPHASERYSRTTITPISSKNRMQPKLTE